MSAAQATPAGHHWDTPRKSMGAASELRACAYLLAQSYDVYRSVAPHAGFDLIAWRDDAAIRVEVKTLGKPKNAAHCPPFGWPVNDEWDLLLIVGPDRIFEYGAGAQRGEASAQIRAHYGLEAGPDELTQREKVAQLLASSPGQAWTAATMAFELGLPRSAVGPILAQLYGEGLADRAGRGTYRACNAAMPRSE
jgi:hypothetical protein